MSALDVLPLDQAKRYLNIPASTITNDIELSDDFIPAAVERVQRHVGRTLVAAEMTASERLAVKVVLAEYWRTQRVTLGGRSLGAAASLGASEIDSDPAGSAPLRIRLVELLGPSTAAGDGLPDPVGAFPPAAAWPDPVPCLSLDPCP